MYDPSFKGFTYNKLSREYDWFEKPPSLITPYELVKWAISCGGWSTYDDEYHGDLVWFGPAGPAPWIGSCPVKYDNDDVALQVMRSHYTHWWGQREMIKKAFEAMEASNKEPADKKEEPPEFRLPDSTDPPQDEDD